MEKSVFLEWVVEWNGNLLLNPFCVMICRISVFHFVIADCQRSKYIFSLIFNGMIIICSILVNIEITKIIKRNEWAIKTVILSIDNHYSLYCIQTIDALNLNLGSILDGFVLACSCSDYTRCVVFCIVSNAYRFKYSSALPHFRTSTLCIVLLVALYGQTSFSSNCCHDEQIGILLLLSSSSCSHSFATSRYFSHGS